MLQYDYENIAKGLQSILRMLQSSVFNCFYSARDPIRATQYNKTISIFVILWNILFNLGYLYTNVKNILFFFYYDAAGGDLRKWNSLGKSFGDFLVRFIYSRYIASS